MAELASTLNQANDPFGFSKIASQKSPIERSKAARAIQPEVLRQQSEAERAVKQAETEAKTRQAQETTKVEQAFQTGMESAQQTLATEMGEAPQRRFQEFNPNAGLELAGLTAIIGAFIGGSSARGALAAMEGITEGYRLGEQDLYERSVKDFEYQLQEYNAKVARAKENYNLAMKAEEARRGAGLAKLKEFAPELSGTVAEAHLRNNDLKRYKESLDDMTKLGDQMQLKLFEAGIKPKVLAPRLTTVEGVDENGKSVPLVVDVNAQGFNPSNVRIGAPGVIGKAPPKAAQSGVRERSFALRTYTALKGLVPDFKNLLLSPETATMPALAGITAADPNTILGSLVALTARDMTPEDERAFQQLSEQIAASLARVEAQGLASGTTQANVRSFDALRPKAGDKAINMALYLARLKQEIEIGLDVFETNAGATDRQLAQIPQLKEEVKNLLPFDIEDVLSVMSENKTTLGKSMQKLLNQSPIFETIQDAIEIQGARMNEQDRAALSYAYENPNDPRSAEILKRLGVR